jgi:hypothetical protein
VVISFRARAVIAAASRRHAIGVAADDALVACQGAPTLETASVAFLAVSRLRGNTLRLDVGARDESAPAIF